MSHHLTRLVATCAVAILGLAASTTGAAADTIRTDDPAAAAAGWLMGQFAADGSLPGFSGDPDCGVTADAVPSLVASGYGAEQVTAATGFLAASCVDGFGRDSSTVYAGRLGKLVLALVAGGADPTDVGGTDLVALIEGSLTDRGDGTAVHAGGDGDSVSKHALALLGLVAADRAPDPAAIDLLVGQVCGDGGYQIELRDDPATACTAQDTNTTAYAAMALAAVGADSDETVAWFAAAQNDDGGFGFTPGSDSDGNSTGLVLAALHATDAPGPVVADALEAQRSFQLTDCTVPADAGSFEYGPSFPGPNLFATAQVIVGVAGRALPVAPAIVSSDTPTLCPADAGEPSPAQPSQPEPAPDEPAEDGSTGDGELPATGVATATLALLGLAAIGSGTVAARRGRSRS